MGQAMELVKDMSHDKELPTERVLYDENDENGMIIQNHYIPPEIWTQIFIYHTDRITLLKCQLVCKRWNDLIRSYVWRKKAEIVNRSTLPHDLQWQDYHLMYKKQPLKRNLIKNHSGEEGTLEHWKVLLNRDGRSRGGWSTEYPPVGVPPMPEDPFFGPGRCFVTSFLQAMKEQTIDLIQEGLNEDILDNYKPRIIISEWYSCRWDCPATYINSVELLNGKNEIVASKQVIENLEGEKQNVWLHHSHTFENYESGVRKITFRHGGKDNLFWAGQYGSKMARACILIEEPSRAK